MVLVAAFFFFTVLEFAVLVLNNVLWSPKGSLHYDKERHKREEYDMTRNKIC